MVMLRNLENWAGEALDLWRVEVAVSVVVFPVNFEHRTCTILVWWVNIDAHLNSTRFYHEFIMKRHAPMQSMFNPINQ